MRKGWFIIEGLQAGDRTLEEQMLGVSEALAEAPGKTVLDLGCAEGLVGREFVRAGAQSVLGIDSIAAHIHVAQNLCRKLPMKFIVANLQDHAAKALSGCCDPAFDIVLSLGVCHKLKEPAVGIRYSARMARDLLLVRLSRQGESAQGILRSKHYPEATCNVNEIVAAEGFRLERTLPGPRGEEIVQHWRRA